MKILWLNLSVPSRYTPCFSGILGGWQDSLQSIVMEYTDVELTIAFKGHGEVKKIEGVTYIPITVHFSRWERLKNNFTWNIEAEKLLQKTKKIVDEYSPDVIHVFGTEWPFGLVAQITKVPVVIHVQGAIASYYNAYYPPHYNVSTYVMAMKGNIARYAWYYVQSIKQTSRKQMERRVWNSVENYMGRTCWDKAVTEICHPGRKYFHVDEALRPAFLAMEKQWKLPADKKLRLITIGCSTLYKGLDMMIKTASLLKKSGIDFEWKVAGHMPNEFRMMVEYKEKKRFADCGINLIGMTKPEQLVDILCASTLYVHTAYIENSPNSICEAQILGVPIVSTNVGGISSLVIDGEEGVLIPANDPYRMAFEILQLAGDPKRMLAYSEHGKTHARKRHDPELIVHDLITCYHSLIQNNH